MSAATMMRSSTSGATRASARPRATGPAVSARPVAPRVGRQAPSRRPAVQPQAYCSPFFPSGVRMVRPRYVRSQAPFLYNLPSALSAADTLLNEFARSVAVHPIDIATFPDRYELTSDTPGMGPEDITVDVTPEGILKVEGSRKAKSQPKDATEEKAGSSSDSDAADATTASSTSTSAFSSSAKARPSYQFSRSFKLPEDAVADDVSASLDKGVLTVVVPRRAPAPKEQPRRVRINHAGGGSQQL